MLNSPVRSSKSEANNDNFNRQGSFRKVLPASTSHPSKELFGRHNEDLNKVYRTIHQEYIILAEYKMLQSENLQGIYVIPSKESSLKWFGVIFVRSGLYDDGIFRFTITLPENFPDGGHPKVLFDSEVYHPVINEDTNELHLLDGFPVWNKGEQHIWQVLKYIHWIFYNVSSSLAHAVNLQAVDLYKHNLDAFKERVKYCVKLGQDHLYDNPSVDDKHYITFERYVPERHDSIRNQMLTPNSEERAVTLGPTWVQQGSFKALTRPLTPDSETES